MSADTELHGFNVRTQVDDLIGKLMFIRDRDYHLEAPGLLSALDDADEIIERACDLVADREVVYLPMSKDESGSPCYIEVCSCGQMAHGADR